MRRDEDGQLSLLLWVDSKDAAVFSFTRPDSPERWNEHTVKLDKEWMKCMQTCLDVFWATSILDRNSPKHKVTRLAVGIFSSNAVGGMIEVRKAEASVRSRHESLWSAHSPFTALKRLQAVSLTSLCCITGAITTRNS